MAPSPAEPRPPAESMSASTDRWRFASAACSMATMSGSASTLVTTAVDRRSGLVGRGTGVQAERGLHRARDASRRGDHQVGQTFREALSEQSRTSGCAMIRLVVAANVSLSTNVPERPDAHVRDERQDHEQQQRDAEQERTDAGPSAQR